MRTVVTGGHLTMLSLIRDWFFRPYTGRSKEQPQSSTNMTARSCLMLLRDLNFSRGASLGRGGNQVHHSVKSWFSATFKPSEREGSSPLTDLLTLMMLWQVDSGSPTKLVPLMDMIWSPMFSLPDRSAGPACIMLAMMTVGKMEPHPLSTMTTPRISPLAFSIKTWGAQSSWQRSATHTLKGRRRAHVFAVLRLGEVDEVVVVHVLRVEQVAVLLLAQVLRVDAVGP